MKFEDRAYAELLTAKKRFGEHTYHDKGAYEVMDVESLNREVKRMGVAKAGSAMVALAKMDDTEVLVRSIVLGLDEWDGFDDLLEQFPELAQYY